MANGTLKQPDGAQPGTPTPTSRLDRVGQSLIEPSLAFLNNQTLAERELEQGKQALLETQIEGNRQQNEAARIAAEEQQQIQNLSRIAFTPGGGAEADAALNELFARDPTQADRLFDGLGARDQASREEAARDAAAIQALPFPQRRAAILERAARIEAVGRDASQTLSLLDMDEETQTNQLRVVQAAALTAAQRRAAEGKTSGTPAEQQTFEALIADFTPEEQAMARKIQAGLEARAGTTTSIERQVQDPDLGEAVTELEADRDARTKFAEMTGASRANAIDTGFEAVSRINTNIRNLDKALEAIDRGASTGAIESRFAPTLREATVELEQIQAQLGLDVVQSVQFGALSEGELQLALATALPTGLQPDALRDWIVRRQEAQSKLRDYYSEQIDFLDNGGTIAGFIRKQRREERGSGSGDTLSFDAEGNLISE